MTASDEELIAKLENLFLENPEYGLLNAPQTDGLLAIARMGRHHWNAWRKRNPSVLILFRRLNTNDLRGINFSGFHFPTTEYGPCVDFSGTHFSSGNKFKGTHFGDDACFNNSVFDSTDFGYAKFGNRAEFTCSKHNGHVNFQGCVFGDNTEFRSARIFSTTNFSKTVFGDSTHFSSAHFYNKADFLGASFGKYTRFDHAFFGTGAIFRGCEFGDILNFRETRSSGLMDFENLSAENKTKFRGFSSFRKSDFSSSDLSGCLFLGDADFSCAKITGPSKFNKVEFYGKADFTGASLLQSEFIETTFLRSAIFNEAVFNESLIFLSTIFCENAEFKAPQKPTKNQSDFLAAHFLGCWFAKGAVFRDRRFKGTVLFGKTQPGDGRDLKEVGRILGIPTKRHHADKTVFLGIPDFHGCKFHQDTSFVGTEFEVPPGNDAARAFRTLKLAMEGLKSSHEEQMFFRLEMEADRPDLPRGRQWISRLYWASSNYGHSLLRPFMTLIGFMVIFGATHGLLTNLYHVTDLSPSLSEFDSERTWQWFRYVLINTFPVPGFDKVQMDLRIGLFGQDGYLTTIATILEMLHKVISLGCVFLLGLALRNLFKMKS